MSLLWLLSGFFHVAKIPDEDRVVVGAADYLKLIKLEAKNTTSVLLKKISFI